MRLDGSRMLQARAVALLFLVLLLAGVTVWPVSAYEDAHGPGRPEPATEPTTAAIILSDEQFVSGPLRGELAITAFLEAQDSFMADMPLEPVVGHEMPAGPALALLAEGHTISPAVLLTVAENRYGVLSRSEPPISREGLSAWIRQSTAALSRWFYDYYYGGGVPFAAPPDGPAVTLHAGNAATYALRAFFLARVVEGGDPQQQLVAWEAEIAALYERYFGLPLDGRLHARHPSPADWDALPVLKLPWTAGDVWYYTGGPHHFDGSERRPRSGVDFQPAGVYGCRPDVAADHWVAAAAAGRTVDYQSGWVKLDHDGDGDAQTGWQTVYGHVAQRPGDGVWVEEGGRLGHPACRGGFTSGLHLHFGVKFENVWQPITAVTLSGWSIHEGEGGYEGAMTRPGSAERLACFRPDPPRMDCTHAALGSDNEILSATLLLCHATGGDVCLE